VLVFALETFWPAADGYSAARIEEQLVVTADGCEVMTRFPAEELMVTADRYVTAAGVLPTTREHQSHLNRPRTPAVDDVVVAAKAAAGPAGSDGGSD
jgi:Xaa-Pro aminopeptidase